MSTLLCVDYFKPMDTTTFDGSEYVHIPSNCCLSAFIDIIYPGETRRRHFKRLETFHRYNVYGRLPADLFLVYNKEVLVDDLENQLLRNVRFVQLDSKECHPEHPDFYSLDYLTQIRDTLLEQLYELISEKLNTKIVLN